MKTISIDESGELSSSMHFASDETVREWDYFLFSLESLRGQWDIVVRDLDRFASEASCEERLVWLDRPLLDVTAIDLLLEEIPVTREDHGEIDLQEMGALLLGESDRLLELSEEVDEAFGDYRLAVRLRGLAAACFEAVRAIPPSHLAPRIRHEDDFPDARPGDDELRAA